MIVLLSCFLFRVLLRLCATVACAGLRGINAGDPGKLDGQQPRLYPRFKARQGNNEAGRSSVLQQSAWELLFAMFKCLAAFLRFYARALLRSTAQSPLIARRARGRSMAGAAPGAPLCPCSPAHIAIPPHVQQCLQPKYSRSRSSCTQRSAFFSSKGTLESALPIRGPPLQLPFSHVRAPRSGRRKI